MKVICSWMFISVFVAGLAGDPSSSWAQPVNGSAPANAAQPSPNDANPSAPDVTQPSSNSAEPSIGGGAISTLAIDALDKPWNRGVPEDYRWAARELFLEGNRLFRIPLFAKAAEKYIAALSKWKHPAIYLNLAIAQLNAGQEVEARDSLEHALEHGEEPLGADNFRGAQLQLEQVTRQLGRIRVSCQTHGAQVTLDGVLLFIGPGNYEGWVKAKDHEIIAKKPEYMSEARRVTIASGQHQNIDLRLLTLSAAANASHRWAVWKPWAALAAGMLTVGIGGIFHTLAFQDFKQYDRDLLNLYCTRRPTDQCYERKGTLREPPKLYDKRRLASQERLIAASAYVAGGSLAVISVLFLYLNRTKLVDQHTEISPGRRVMVTPMISDGSLGISVQVNR